MRRLTSEALGPKPAMIADNITAAVGNTPLVRLRAIAADRPYRIVAKLECANPGGSAKDRSALAMVCAARAAGRLTPGMTLISASSGNTGIGLAMVGAVLGYRCLCVTTERTSSEKVATLRAFGAKVIVCPASVQPEDPRSYLSVARRLAEEVPNSYFLFQHGNEANVQAAYEGTGAELWSQTAGKLTHVFCGLGTGATAVGIARYMRDQEASVQVVGVEPEGSIFASLLRGEVPPSDARSVSLTEGIGAELVSGTLDFSVLSEVVSVADTEAMAMTRRIARREGILSGPSSGAVVAAAMAYADAHGLGEDDMVVVVLHDTGLRYLSKVFNDAWLKENQLFAHDRESQTAASLCARKHNGSHHISKLMTVAPHSLLIEVVELFHNYEVSQLPVVDGGQFVGSVKEDRVVHLLVRDPDAKGRTVSDVMDASFPLVDCSTTLEQLSDLLTRDNPAVLVKTESGFDILTKADLVRAIAG